MNSQQWFESLRELLRREGLPIVYRRKLVNELYEHFLDITNEEIGMSMDATRPKSLESRLGSPECIAQVAGAEYRRASFAGKHPWLTFVVAPVPVFVLMIAAYVLLLVLGLSVFEDSLPQQSPFVLSLFEGFAIGIAYVPAAGAAALLGVMAIRSDRGWNWLLASCGPVALLASLLTVGWTSPVGDAEGTLHVGAGLGSGAFHWIQFLVPLAIGSVFVLWQQWRQRSTTSFKTA